MYFVMDKKALYLSTTFLELQKLSEIRPVEMKNVQMACTLLNKLFEKHEQAFLDCDEELAFVFIMRFLESLSRIRQIFKNDVKYINALINESKVKLAFDRAEVLKIGLKDRYDLLSDANNQEKTKNEIVKAALKQIDSKVEGNLSCKDLYSKLKGGHDKILIVDTRSEAEFQKCHIKYGLTVNIPSEILFRGCSIVDVNEFFKKQSQDIQVIWQERSKSSTVVILDWENEVSEGLNVVKDAIYKWDSEKTIKEPVTLLGGLKSFLLHYPTLVTDPQYKGPPDNITNNIVNPNDIKYPNWETKEVEKRKLIEDTKVVTTKETIDTSLEDRFKKLRSEKTPASSVMETPSLVVDRSLKPEVAAPKHTTEVNSLILPSDTTNEAPIFKIDRKLKPDLSKQVKTEPITDPNSNTIDKSQDDHRQIRRLSSNSRTDQDRSNFTAKGGAKSIPPPPDTDKTKLPPGLSREFDPKTNEYCYFDRNTNKRYTTLPEEYIETHKEPTRTYIDRIETLKDHSLHMSKHPSTGSGMKRSTSQPNLTDEAAATNKSDANDTLDLSISHSSRDPPKLDRLTKPILNKVFDDFSANRLSSFNPNYRKVSPGLTGLRNMGNTCYMNSVIQALSNTNFLTNYILTGSYQHHINRSNPLGYHGELINEFALLTKALWNGHYKDISPSDFKSMVDSKNEMFRGGEQHDSQEFLLFLLDGLHEDLNRGSRQARPEGPSQSPGETEGASDLERAQASWKAHVAINDSVIVKMFQGQYRSKVTCDHCQASSVTFDAFMYLSLPLVTSHSRCSLDDCIKLFLAEEKMTGPSQWFCPKCKTNRNARKKIDIWKLPPYLLIHLKRFSCSGQYRQKLNTFVEFPIETLSLSGILSHTMQPHTHHSYHLYAVSNHHGNMESGHYTSYCKNAKEGDWYNYDDDTVTRIKQSEARTPSAYILFYESYNIKQAAAAAVAKGQG